MPLSQEHKGITFTKTLPLLELDEKDFTDKKNSKFLYCRGFLLCENNDIKLTDSFTKSTIDLGSRSYSLYTHDMLEVEKASDNNVLLYVMGFTYFTNTKYIDDNISNAQILLNEFNKSKHDFLMSLNSLAGRYCIIIKNKNELLVYNDASALKSVYYSRTHNVIASHLELVNLALGGKLEKSEVELNKQKNNYYYAYTYLGNFTNYKDVFCLTPNFELTFEDTSNGCVEKRFYPMYKKKSDTLENVKKEYYDIMQISIKELLKKNRKICLSLTGGKDSRVSYYTIKDYVKDVIFFTEERDNDIEISKNLALKDNLKWIGVDSRDINLEDNPLKKGFQEIITKNVFPSQCQFVLRGQFWNLNIFGCKNYIHIQSNCAETGRGRKSFYAYFSDSWNFDNFKNEFVRLMSFWKPQEFKDKQTEKVNNDPEFLRLLKSFYDLLNLDAVKELGYNPWDFVYNEHRVANFLSQTHMYNDICFESISLTNCREIFETMWKLPEKDINRSNLLYNSILKDNNAE